MGCNECLSTPYFPRLRRMSRLCSRGSEAQRDDRSRAACPVCRGGGFFNCAKPFFYPATRSRQGADRKPGEPAFLDRSAPPGANCVGLLAHQQNATGGARYVTRLFRGKPCLCLPHPASSAISYRLTNTRLKPRRPGPPKNRRLTGSKQSRPISAKPTSRRRWRAPPSPLLPCGRFLRLLLPIAPLDRLHPHAAGKANKPPRCC